MVYSLRQPGQLGNQLKSLCEKIHPTYQNFYTGNNPAAGTKSIGLPADAQAAKVFAAQLRHLYHDETTLHLQPGPAKTLQP
jgi:hypothetical protein